MSNIKESFKFFEILSHSIRLNIIKELNISYKQFSDLLSTAGEVDSAKFNFHLKKLLDANIIIKREKTYQLSDFGLKALFFIETYENNDLVTQPIDEIEPFEDNNSINISNSSLETENTGDKKTKLPFTKIENLLPGVQTFDYYVGIYASYLEENYFLPLPKAIDSETDPRIWIKEFIKPI